MGDQSTQEVIIPGDREEFKKEMKEMKNKFTKIPLNIGIIGYSKAGKSSFVNAIRGLADNDEKAALVASDTTNKPTPYIYSEDNPIIFWDLPAVKLLDPETKCDMIDFEEFDFFLIILATRVEDMKSLIRKIIEQNKEYFVIRTKIEDDVQNNKMSGSTKSYDDILKEVRKNVEEELEKTLKIIEEDLKEENHKKEKLEKIKKNLEKIRTNLKEKKNVFLIDNYEREEYDFKELQLQIYKNLYTWDLYHLLKHVVVPKLLAYLFHLKW